MRDFLKKINKIRNKLLALLLLVVLIPIFVLGYLAIKSVKQTRLENIQELERQLISQLNDRLKKYVDDKIESYRINIADPNVTAIGPEQQNYILKSLLLNDSSIEEASFIEPSGHEESHTHRDSSKNSQPLENLTKNEAFKTAIEGQDYISSIYFRDKTPLITIASPIVNQKGEIIAVLQTKINLNGLSDLIANSILGNNGYSYITAQDGKIISVSERISKDLIGQYSENINLKESDLEKIKTSVITIPGLTGEPVFSGVKTIPKLNWLIITEWPKRDAMGIIDKILKNLEIFTILLLSIAFLLGIISSRYLIKPIHKLKEGTDAISKGEFDMSIHIKTGDELEDLGNAFNVMALDLKKLDELQKEKQKRLECAFGQYVGDSMLENVLSGEKIKLGGERKYITILFADIKNFTTISESLEPEILIKYLNKYLTAMTDIIMRHGGTIDKYIGDAILAFWGAPLPIENHAYQCVLATEEMMEKLNEIKKEWKDGGLPEIDIRVGISSGGILVGNVGSEQRLSYTVIGDTVNLAARLESLNKLYKTRCMISANTYIELRGKKVLVRELDQVEVKGKTESIKIYELFAVKDIKGRDIKKMIDDYEEALNLYRLRKWDSAIKIFANILNDFPEDGPSEVMLARAQSYAHNPPSPEWNGTYHATEK